MRTNRFGINEISYAVFAAVAIAWALVAADYWVFITTVAILLAISTLGLTVVVGWAREVSLVQAGLTGTAVYLGGYAYRSNGGWGLPFVVAAVFAIGVVVLLSVLLSLGTAKLSGIYIIVLTLGLQLALEKTVFASYKLTGGQSAIPTPRPALFGLSFNNDRAFYLLCLAMLGAMVLLLARLRSSRHGQALMLVGTDRQAAASVGISPFRYKMLAFAIAGFFAGVAGVFISPLFRTPPAAFTFFALNSLFYLAIPVLAGFQSLFGVILVAVAFGLAPQALEPFHISPLLLGGIGLYGGTLAGRSGLSGLVSGWKRKLQRPPAETRIPAAPDEMELRDQAAYALSGEER
jgi:ABC-type branched-subunit amino acid transport system permease subunit